MTKGKTFLLAFLSVCLLSSMALANGLNLNSLGTKALTMGGAFVGLADDFSAIYWNPAGMAQFDRRYFGFYGTDILPSQKYILDVDTPLGTVRLVNAETERKHYLSGLAAYYHPVSDRLIVGVGAYVPSGLGANWDGADFVNVSRGTPYDWTSKIGLITFAPSIAYKVNERLSIGASLNINYGLFNISMHAGSQPNPAPPPPEIDLGQYEESMSGWGYGATIGVLYKLNEMFSFGASFRTPSKVKFSGDASISNLSFLGMNGTSDLERDVTWPMWFAVGVAFKPIEELTLTGDLHWTQWSKLDYIETDFLDPGWAGMMEVSGDDRRPLLWDNVLQIRFGAEYRLNSLALRAGYYWDPSPAPNQTMNVLVPNFDYHVITLGVGYNLNGLQLDFGLEYLMGRDRSVPFNVVPILVDPFFTIENPPGYEKAMPGDYSMNIIVPNVSISYKF